ncbi:hypothetical protein EF847_01465 [Actinobacteria bacterium YIM 96077]|nr:hypothetical protein EF847_01465 [Actinobacteria bacterium YIM 96077]
MYNVQALHDADERIYVLEGEFNAIVMELIGCPTLATGSAAKWYPHWTRLLESYPEVVVVRDPDDAGKAFAKKVRDQVSWARVIEMPEGEDPNSIYVNYGPDELENRLT